MKIRAGLPHLYTKLLYTVLKTHANFGVQRTIYKITGTIIDMCKYGVN